MVDYDRLDAAAEEAARSAKCSRCEVTVLQDLSALGIVHGTFQSPATGTAGSYILCGKCGLAFREFVHPKLLDDPVYRQGKQQLLEAWV